MDAERLRMMEWNSFERYPEQGRDIYLKVVSQYSGIIKFVKVFAFNAAIFNPKKTAAQLGIIREALFMWLPAYEVEKG